MRFFVTCRHCTTRLSRTGRRRASQARLDVVADAEDVCERGTLVPMDDGSVYLHHSDGLDVALHPQRRHGCCGVSSLAGRNVLCGGCRQEVGWLDTDCVGPNFIRYASDAAALHPDRSLLVSVLERDELRGVPPWEMKPLSALVRSKDYAQAWRTLGVILSQLPVDASAAVMDFIHREGGADYGESESESEP